MMGQQMAKDHKLSPRQGQKGSASDSGQDRCEEVEQKAGNWMKVLKYNAPLFRILPRTLRFEVRRLPRQRSDVRE